jgi:UDP-N-acetyl-D-glucosamine dehydrogenase
MRESPALEVIEHLREKGAKVLYNDPYILKIPKVRKHALDMASVPLTAKLLKSVEAVMIITDHTAYDYRWIAKHTPLIVDTRNATRRILRHKAKIVKA